MEIRIDAYISDDEEFNGIEVRLWDETKEWEPLDGLFYQQSRLGTSKEDVLAELTKAVEYLYNDSN